MNKKYLFLILIILFVAVLLLLSGGGSDTDIEEVTPPKVETFIDTTSKDIPTPDESILGNEGTLYVYTIDGEITGATSLRLSYGANGGYPTLNVALDSATEAAPSVGNFEWVVKNKPSYVIGSTLNNYSIEFDDVQKLERDSFTARVAFTDTDYINEGWFEDDNDVYKEVSIAVETFELSDILGLNVPGNGPGLYRGGASLGFFTVAHAQTNNLNIPDLDVDLDLDIPDLSQSSMECAPTSITNNMIGLSSAHGQRGDLPSAEAMIRQLKEDLKFGDEGRDGVLDKNFVAGKNAFMNRYNLPIVTTEITNPSFEDIADALSNGAVVEMDLAFFGRNASGAFEHVASHVTTVTGISSDGGEFELRGRDSSTPEGGESWQFFPKQDGQPQSQMAYPKWREGATIINKIYIQEWVTVDEAISAGVLPAGAVGSTLPVEMLVIDGNYYPKDQFSESNSPEDACGAPHYHKNTEAVGLKNKTDTDLAFKGDPAPRKCGFGKVSSVPVETVNITWQQQQNLAAGLSTP